MPTFTPKTDEELNPLIPANEVCNFEIVNAENKTSEKGYEMIKLNLKLWASNGKEYYIFDYLIFGLESMEWKIKHFCSSVGLDSQYNQGVIEDSHCIGKSGSLLVGIEKDKQGKYADRNTVKDYLSPGENKTETKPPFNDDVPF